MRIINNALISRETSLEYAAVIREDRWCTSECPWHDLNLCPKSGLCLVGGAAFAAKMALYSYTHCICMWKWVKNSLAISASCRAYFIFTMGRLNLGLRSKKSGVFAHLLPNNANDQVHRVSPNSENWDTNWFERISVPPLVVFFNVIPVLSLLLYCYSKLYYLHKRQTSRISYTVYPATSRLIVIKRADHDLVVMIILMTTQHTAASSVIVTGCCVLLILSRMTIAIRTGCFVFISSSRFLPISRHNLVGTYYTDNTLLEFL